MATYYGIQTNYFSYKDAQGRYIWNAPSGFGLTNTVWHDQPDTDVQPHNIPVYVNGQYAYSSAVQRLLQLAANIYDTSTNSFYPFVFRPLFEHDNFGNVFIAGYTNISSGSGLNTVSGSNDNQLATPYNVSYLTNYSGSSNSLPMGKDS